MPSIDAAPEPGLNPWAPAEEFVHALTGSLVRTAIGLAIGAIANRQMRKAHLHWSWAAAALGLVTLARASLGALALPLAAATMCATLRGRRSHRADLAAGADLADIAVLRRTPLDLVRTWPAALAVRFRLFERIEHTVRARLGGVRAENELVIGRDERGRAVSIPFGAHGGGRHALVVGATGSGKTVTQTYIAVEAVRQGMGAIVLDPKGDDRMRDQLCRATVSAGRTFLEWTPAGDLVYNPFASGGETELVDKSLAGERFTEPHYLRQAQRYLGHVIRALRSSRSEISLRGIVELLDPDCLEQLARSLPEIDAERTFAYLDSLSARQRSDLAGVRDRLAIMVESDVGPWLDPGITGAPALDLPAAVRTRSTVYFRLESDSRPLLAQMLGAAIVQDLQTTAAALQSRPVSTIVVIDEFSAIAAEQVARLFGRARSAGFSLLLGTQELSDLRPPGRERLLEQVMGNLSVLVAHRQVVPGSAQLIAEVSGRRGAWRVSHHSDGRATRVRTREGVLDAGRIMGLGQGWAAVIVPGASSPARIAAICAP